MTDEEKKLNKAIEQDGIETQTETLEELKRRYPQYVEKSNDQQEIDRIEQIIANKSKSLSSYDIRETSPSLIYAITLVNAGIGDKKQAVKEAFEKLKEIFNSHEASYYDEQFKSWRDVNVKIDELYTELYGADE